MKHQRSSRIWAGTAMAAVLAVSACGGGTEQDSAPDEQSVEVDNCGTTYTFDQVPERVVSTSLPTTEMMLALGLADRLAGAVQAAGSLLPEYEEDFEGVPIIAESAFPPPSREVVLAAGPDLIVSGYPDDYGPQALGDRASLLEDGINTYLVSGSCDGVDNSLDNTYDDLRTLGRIFDVGDKAEELIERIESEAEAVDPVDGDAPVVLDLHSGAGQAPLTTGTTSLTDDLITRAGGTTAFPEVTEFTELSWEEIVERNPDVILVSDFTTLPGEETVDYLRSYGPIAGVTAVAEDNFIIVPGTSTEPGMANGAALATIAEGLREAAGS